MSTILSPSAPLPFLGKSGQGGLGKVLYPVCSCLLLTPSPKHRSGPRALGPGLLNQELDSHISWSLCFVCSSVFKKIFCQGELLEGLGGLGSLGKQVSKDTFMHGFPGTFETTALPP